MTPKFRHFRQVFILLVQRFPDICDTMIQSVCPRLSQPYMVHFIRHIYDSNISDCILALLYRYVGNEPRELRQERFYQLAGMEFMDRLFGMLNERLTNKVPKESLPGIFEILDKIWMAKNCVKSQQPSQTWLSELFGRARQRRMATFYS